MKKEDIIDELIDILELEDDITLETEISLDSLSMLSVIAFLDENFSATVTLEALSEVSTINDIMQFITEDHIT